MLATVAGLDLAAVGLPGGLLTRMQIGRFDLLEIFDGEAIVTELAAIHDVIS